MKKHFFKASENVRTTWIFMSSLLVLIIGIGFCLAYYYKSPNFLYWAIIGSLGLNVFSYYFSDKLVLRMANAKPIKSEEDYPELYTTVRNLAEKANLPMPKLYVIDDPAPNAFATGRNKDHAVVAVTTGLLPLLTKSELEGVLAHELGHIGNRDMLLQTVVVVIAGAISLLGNFVMLPNNGDGDRRSPLFAVLFFVAIILAPLAASLIKLAISREREFLADKSAALLTGYPEGLASALEKISGFHQPMRRQNAAIAHLFISDPSGVNDMSEARPHERISPIAKLFMTHPPVRERVAALQALSRSIASVEAK